MKGPPREEDSAAFAECCGQALLLKHRAGDPQAFPELVQLLRSRVYSYIIRAGVSASTSDDLFQEVFLKVHLAAHSYDPARPFDPWLFTIVANTVRSLYRKRKVHDRVFSAQEAPEAGSEQLHALSEAQETARWLESQIHALPEGQREVVNLALSDLSLPDIAETLSMPLGTVKTNLRRGRLALAAALSRRHAQMNRETAR